MPRFEYSGKTALVTGASSGIGEGFASYLAKRCARVILVARDSERLHDVARQLNDQFPAQVVALPADLSTETAASDLKAACDARGWTIDVVVNNAGFGTFGRFDELSADVDAGMIQLNITAVCNIAHAFLPPMILRKSGVLINTASSAALLPTAWFAVYGATKAFVLSLSESLWALYRGHGVRVCAVCPGPVDTGFFDKTNSDIGAVGVFQKRISASQVVQSALKAVDQGNPVALCDWPTRIQTVLSRLSPRSLVALVSEKTMRPPRAHS
jgi:short-subunit dehydrogenase